ncbi:MAG: PP2C family protein-serine/threonine phosphatase [bacterium]
MTPEPSGVGSSVIFIFSSILELLLAIGVAYLFFRYQRLRKERDELLQEKEIIFGFVHDVGEVFAEAEKLEPDLLLKRVLFYALRTTKASSGAIYLYGSGSDELQARAVSGIFPPLTDKVSSSLDTVVSRSKHIENLVRTRMIHKGEGLVGEVADLGTPILIEDAERDLRVPRHEIDFLKIRSILLVPMHLHQHVLGVLAVVNRVDGNPFDQTDLNLLQALADQASASVHYAGLRDTLDEKKRIDHDLHVARRIQNSLLPKELPHVQGVEVAAFNDPAQEIGGDYYDFVPIDDKHLGIVIADVSGKGVGGAILMSVCRSVLRAQAPGNLSPAAVLRSINRVMSKDISEDMFVSMLYMVLHVDTHELSVARAGHERPILLSRDGHVEPIESPGTAIGMMDVETFERLLGETTIQIKPGDVIVAYTDGITEAMNSEGEEWGMQNFLEAVRQASSEGANSVLNNVRQRLARFVGENPQYDDMTLVALRHLG